MAKIIAPRLLVLTEDDLEYDVQTDNRDMVRYDMHAAKQKWPAAQDAPMLYLTFLAVSALRREKKLAVADFDAGMDKLLSVVPVDEDGNPLGEDIEGMTVDPTQKEA